MAQQEWINLLNYGSPWQTQQGTALSASATTATISPQAPTGQDFVLPGQPSGLQWYTGMSLRVKARGIYGSGGTASNLTIILAVGATSALGTNLITSGALALGTGSISNLRWRFEAQVDVVNIRTDANPFLSITGDLYMQTAVVPATLVGGTSNFMCIPLAYTTVNGSTISPYTAATAMGMRATLSAAYGNITCDRFTIEQLS